MIDHTISEPSYRVIHHEFGRPDEVLHVEGFNPFQTSGPGQVRVRVTRSMIHPGDLQRVAAKFGGSGGDILLGRVPGSEGAGVITEVGRDWPPEAALQIGSRVAFMTNGAWQSSLVLDGDGLLPLPDDIDDDVATQLLVNVVTARHVLRKALSGPTGRPSGVVLTAAASAVGKLITVQARREGIPLVRLVRSAPSAERLASKLPGGFLLDTFAVGWEEAVRDAMGGAVPLIIDGVGGAMISAAGRLLDPGGRIVSFGLLDGGPADLTMFIPKGLTLIGVTMGSWQADTTPAERNADYMAAIEIARSDPQVFADAQIFDVTELASAIDAVTRPGKAGNILLRF